MKIVHIESGLGNQMLSYCEYLALKKIHPNEQCFIETLVYDIPECNELICQWNGFELDKIFNINAQNIKSRYSKEQWNNILANIKDSQFWLKKWNWPVYFCEAFNKEGEKLKNIRGNFEENNYWGLSSKEKPPLKHRIRQTGIYSNIRRIYKNMKKDKYIKSDVKNLFYEGSEDVLTGQRLTFKNRNNNIEKIDKEIKETFKFPEIEDEENKKYVELINSCNSVAIHARRGDMLSLNGKYYKSGYFHRATKYIKKNVKNPVFFFFCDPGSIEWCKKNSKIFGLDFKKDKIYFVDCNSAKNSFRDMQLMSMCKHNIITNSTFGWWGAYLNTNPNKITISPEIEINTTHHF